MAINIKVIVDGKQIERIFLKARKTIDGNIIVSDHPEMDIFIYPGKSKVVCMPKEELDDELYDAQNRFLKFLSRRGVVDPESIQAGNLFMTMEAAIVDADIGDKIQYLLYVISDFVEEDLPYYEDQKEFEKEVEASLLEPEPDEYTEFNPEKYHRSRKGSLPPKWAHWGIHSIYRI